MKLRNDVIIPLCLISFIAGFLLSSCDVKADVLLGITAKYGANGYDAEGYTTSTTTSSYLNRRCRKSSGSTYTTTNGYLDVENRYELVPGLSLQTIPENKYGLSFGTGIYLDQTINMFLGIRL